MLRANLVGKIEGLVEIADDDHRAALDQRSLDLARARQTLQRDFNRLGDTIRDTRRGRQQHRSLVAGTVLGLRNQVGGDPFGMRAVVGNHQHLARSRHLVDIGDAVNHPLGGLHVRVAGPDDLVHRLDGLRAVRERRDRMRSADAVEFVDSRNFRSRQHGEPLALRRRRRDHHDFGDARDLGGNRIHQHRRRIRAEPARHVNPDAAHRLHHLPQPHPGLVAIDERFLHRAAMELRDSLGRQFQRAAILSRDTIDRRMPFRRRHPQRRRGKLHVIKFRGEIDQRAIAALSHVGDNLRHRAVDGGAVAAPAREYRGQEFFELRGLRLEDARLHYS